MVGIYSYHNTIRIQEMNDTLLALGDHILPEDRERLKKNNRNWNFYEGYHWEDIPLVDKPQITRNYCRPFVDKFVAFEFGKGFNLQVPHERDDEVRPVTDFLKSVWEEHNNQHRLCYEIGQTKSVTGNAWVQVKYEGVDELNDPYGEFSKGRIRLINMSPNTVFPEYDPHDKDKLIKISVIYPIKEVDKSVVLKNPSRKTRVYKMVWTDKEVYTQIDKEEPTILRNPYGVIPFVEIVNTPIANRNGGASDLDDIIPLNIELNLKVSDISEIIDYHSAPVTLVYGANVDNLERGANKMWGGLPKDSKVENLVMSTDLGASIGYTNDTQMCIHDIGSVPRSALGDTQSISNTSGVALQITHMPLIEKTRTKKISTIEGFKNINRLILLMGLQNDLVQIQPSVSVRDFYTTEVVFSDALPKDELIELQKIEMEMRLGLESRQNAMNKLGKNTKIIQEQLNEDFINNSEFYGHAPKLNSGMLNGETPNEMLNKETMGQNISM